VRKSPRSSALTDSCYLYNLLLSRCCAERSASKTLLVSGPFVRSKLQNRDPVLSSHSANSCANMQYPLMRNEYNRPRVHRCPPSPLNPGDLTTATAAAAGTPP
jgi:hypothetical protein